MEQGYSRQTRARWNHRTLKAGLPCRFPQPAAPGRVAQTSETDHCGNYASRLAVPAAPNGSPARQRPNSADGGLPGYRLHPAGRSPFTGGRLQAAPTGTAHLSRPNDALQGSGPKATLLLDYSGGGGGQGFATSARDHVACPPRLSTPAIGAPPLPQGRPRHCCVGVIRRRPRGAGGTQVPRSAGGPKEPNGRPGPWGTDTGSGGGCSSTRPLW